MLTQTLKINIKMTSYLGFIYFYYNRSIRDTSAYDQLGAFEYCFGQTLE